MYAARSQFLVQSTGNFWSREITLATPVIQTVDLDRLNEQTRVLIRAVIDDVLSKAGQKPKS